MAKSEETIKTMIEITGNKEYKEACEEIETNLKLLSSEMRVVTATFKDNDKSTKALRKSQKVLKDEFAEQKKIVKMAKESLQDMKSEGLEKNSSAVKHMKTVFNNATADMKETKNEIKDNSKELRKSNIIWVAMGKTVGAVGKTVGAVGKAMGALGKTVGTVVKGLGGGFLGLGKMAVEAAAGAQELGDVLGEDAVKSLSDFDDKMQGLNKSMSGLQGAASLVALPFLDVLAADGISIMDDFSQGLQDADGDMGKMAAVIETALEDAVGLITERLPELVDMGVGIITALVEGVVDSVPEIAEAAVMVVTSLAEGLLEMLPMLLDGALQLVLGIAEGIGEALPELIPTIVELVTELVQVLIDNIPLLVDAAVQIMEGLTQGIIEAIPILVDALPELISSLITALQEGIPQIIEAGISLLTAIVGALPDIIIAIVEVLPQIIIGIVEALFENIPLIVQAGIDLITALIQALPEIIAAIVAAIPEIIAGIVEAFIENREELKKAGLNLINAVWEGIKNTGKWLWEQISGFFGDILNKIKNFLGIHSPSTVFAGFGKNMAVGLGIGFTGEIVGVGQQLRTLLRGLTNGLEAEMGIAPIQATVWGEYQSVPYLKGAGTAGSYPFSDRAGGVQVVQNIYANETSYAGQQKEAARQMGVIARRFAL